MDTTQITQTIGVTLMGFLLVILASINKKIASWFINNIWSKIRNMSSNHVLTEIDIENDRKLRDYLIELRSITEADRTCLFQFHNGNVFSTKNPIWKVSNTHESTKPGISSEIGKLQDIKASSVIESLLNFWIDDYPVGVTCLTPKYCKTCKNNLDEKHRHRKIIFIDVELLEDCYSKALLLDQGIKYVINVPIHKKNNNEYIGFVSVCYCTEKTPEELEEIKHKCHYICASTFNITYTLIRE
jgi:hypothetical protein